MGIGVLAWLGGIGAAVAVAHPSSCPTVRPRPRREAVARRRSGGSPSTRPTTAPSSTATTATRARSSPATASCATPARCSPSSRHAGRRRPGGGRRRRPRARLGRAAAHARWMAGRAALDRRHGRDRAARAALVERRRIDGSTADDERAAPARTVPRRRGHRRRRRRRRVGPHRGPSPSTARRSPFFTGEVLWALARAARRAPRRRAGTTPARRISRYLVDAAGRRRTPVPAGLGPLGQLRLRRDGGLARCPGRRRPDRGASWPTPAARPGCSACRRASSRSGVPDGVARLTRGPVAADRPASARWARGWGASWRLAALDDDLDLDRGGGGRPPGLRGRACSSSGRPTATIPASTARGSASA